MEPFIATADPLRVRLDAQLAAEVEREARVSDQLRDTVLPRVAAAVASARASGRFGGRVWLVGSFAWGDPRPNSDIDLVVEQCGPVIEAMAALEAQIGRPVDVLRWSDLTAARQALVERFGVAL